MWTTFELELTKQIEEHILLTKDYKPKKKKLHLHGNEKACEETQ